MVFQDELKSLALELQTKLHSATSIKFIKSGIEVTIPALNDLGKTKRILVSQGYAFKGELKPLEYFFSKKDIAIIVRLEEQYVSLKTVMPDYSNNMLNIIESIKAYYKKETKYPTLKQIDKELSKKPKHLVFMILDGVGINVLENALEKKDFLRKNMLTKIKTVFPPTTACAIPVSMSGKAPIETGWIGWENYFDDLKKSLVLFTGNNYFTNEPTGIDVKKNYLPYDDFYKALGVPYLEIQPEFAPNGVKTFEEGISKMLKFQKEHEVTYTYFYWDEPDGTLHSNGTKGEESIRVLKDINSKLEMLYDSALDDSMFIITADHGHQDVKYVDIRNFPDLTELLLREPSNEARALCFEVKNGKKKQFEDLFNQYFGSIFKLYDKKSFLEEGFLGHFEGTISKRLSSFLGDYIAIATSDYFFVYNDLAYSHLFKSTHAGLTKNEMEVPLIVYSK